MGETPIMRQARLAAERVVQLSPAKRAYLDRVIKIGGFEQSAERTDG